jgi:hypothetical protein
MIDPCLIDEEVRAAELVVQVTVDAVTPPEGGYCVLSGTVVHVLRGPISPGATVMVEVNCLSEPDVMCGGTVVSLPQLQRAEMVELHLTEGAITGAGAGIDLIEAADGGTEQHVYMCLGEP